MELTWSKDGTPFADLQQVPYSNAIIKCKCCGDSICVGAQDGAVSIPSKFHSLHVAHAGIYEVEFTFSTEKN